MLALIRSQFVVRNRVFLLLVAVVALSSPARLLAEPGPWIDLIAKIDGPARGAGGQWTKAGGQLRTSAAASSRIALPYRPSGEYDFRVRFTRTSGVHSVALVFVAGDGQATFEIDAWGEHLAGIQQIGGRDLRANGTRVANQTLTNGREYTARVEVRRDQVRAYLDDKLLVTHRTDGSDLSMLDLWRLPDAKSLGVGAYEADTMFHAIEVRQVSAAPAVASATPTPRSSPPTSSSPKPSNPPMPTTRPTPQPTPRATTSPSPVPAPKSPSSPGRAKTPAVLLVIANRDFYYREYADPRAELERAGVRVVVAAATKGDCFPHPGSGQTGDGRVTADIALADADAADYDAIVFSGGWGSSMYQFAFNGSYANAAYNGNRAVKAAANRLIGDFVQQEKYVAGICHGTSVLAWSRINGQSLLRGKQATGPMREGPAGSYNGRQSQPPSRWNLEVNGARLVAPNSVGERGSAHDDVVVDGKVLTAQDDVSARQLGVVLARLLKSPN